MNNKTKLFQIIENFSQKRIVVWGDLILDEYLYGTTRRISREAPVLILSYKEKEFSLGGGGNSLLNLKSLGAEPVPLGVVGDLLRLQHAASGQEVGLNDVDGAPLDHLPPALHQVYVLAVQCGHIDRPRHL